MATNPFDPPIIQIRKTLERGGMAGANKGFGSVRGSSPTSRPAPGPEALEELDDVDLATVPQELWSLLGWNGEEWVPVPETEPALGDVLSWGGAAWSPTAGGGGGGGATGTMVWRGDWGSSPSVLITETWESRTLPDDALFSTSPRFIDREDPTTGTTVALRQAVTGGGGTNWTSWPIAYAGGNPILVRYWVDSENNFDKFRIDVDGVEVFSDSGQPGAWKTATISGITAGTRVLRMRYTKDGSGNVGFDNVDVGAVTYSTPDSLAAYMLGHVVKHGGLVYVSTVNNNASTPGANADWQLLGGSSGGGGGGGYSWSFDGQPVATYGVTATGALSSSSYPAWTTTLTLNRAALVQKFQWYVGQADTYTLSVDGIAVATVAVATPGWTDFTPAVPLGLSNGSHSVRLSPTAARRWNFIQVAKYQWDWGTLEGWAEVGTTYYPPLKFVGAGGVFGAT